jgi:hypothetical protein
MKVAHAATGGDWIIPESELARFDARLLATYGPGFQTWLDWNKHGYYLPFGYRPPYQRSRIVDFLATTGILDGTNSCQVRAHADSAELRAAIKRIDELETVQLFPVILTHIIATDKSLEWTESHLNRMTPLLQTFLRSIGKPLTIEDDTASKRGLPPFRTTIPVFQTNGGFAAVIAPAMCKDRAGIEKLREQTPTVRIIFNETNFEIAAPPPDGESVVLIVKPSIPGLYHVWQVRGIQGVNSPFSAKQIMSPRAIAFGISLVLQIAAADLPVSPLAAERLAAIATLCQEEPAKELGMIAAPLYGLK